MENNKINLSFGIVVIAFLVIFYILINNFNARRIHDFKDYAHAISNVVKEKNTKIQILSYRLAAEQKQNEDLKKTLTDTRNDLESLTKKLAQPAPVAAPASAPAPAAVTK